MAMIVPRYAPAQNAGTLEGRRLPGDCVGQVPRRHQDGDDGLLCRLLKRPGDAEQCDRRNEPKKWRIDPGQVEETGRAEPLEADGTQQNLGARIVIRRPARQGKQYQKRQEHPDAECGVYQFFLGDSPELPKQRGAHQIDAEDRTHPRDEIERIVGVLESGEARPSGQSTLWLR